MHKILGCDVIISEGQPKMQCSPEFVRLQSPELVASTNQWMADFFGYTQLIPDGQVIKAGNTLAMSQKTFNQVKRFMNDGYGPLGISERK